eukprot:TRINITY_DN60544_c0_g1_i2.p1 TRINITY_DN60544_c0_g1~~TRINITY_DN60544_c0_g1_i2.p1  ORF type:complete len:169 (-),score=26.96 TRINITY_DN60544_c0_g1_i2:33-488(-)
MPGKSAKNNSSAFAKSIVHAAERAYPGLQEVEQMCAHKHPTEAELWKAFKEARRGVDSNPASPSSQRPSFLAESSSHAVSPTLAQAGQRSVPGTPSTDRESRLHYPEVGAPGHMTIQIVRDRTGHMMKPSCSSPWCLWQIGCCLWQIGCCL